jgi:hypothetical protein
MQTPPPDPSLSNYPRPNLAGDRQVLKEVAIAQRHVMLCVLGQLGIFCLNLIAGSQHIAALSIVDMFLALGLLVFMIMSVIRLAKGLLLSPVIYVILMFIPCVSLLMLLSLSGKATKQLQQAGIKVGLLGADPNSI